MAAAISDQTVELTRSVQQAQARQAAITAALVAYYYRTRVDVEDPRSIEAWLALVVPRILADRDRSSRLSAQYGDALRKLELPKATDGFKFDPGAGKIDAEVIRTSLIVTGPADVSEKLKRFDEGNLDRVGRLSHPATRAADKAGIIAEANRVAQVKMSGATMRHIQNGGRDVINDGIRRDKVALGYVRVTKDNPCYFCAMLASRGITSYSDDSFDDSNPRFTGTGTAKVHDHCSCMLKPVYTKQEPFLELQKHYAELWGQAKHVGGSSAQIREFRRLYEGRAD